MITAEEEEEGGKNKINSFIDMCCVTFLFIYLDFKVMFFFIKKQEIITNRKRLLFVVKFI